MNKNILSLVFLSATIFSIGGFFAHKYLGEEYGEKLVLHNTHEFSAKSDHLGREMISGSEDVSKENTDPHHDSIPAMIEKKFEGSDLKMGRVLETNGVYTRYYITYLSEGLKISGIMNLPKGEGPFPVIVANHGYIDPEIYTNGRGLKREQDHLARSGYVVIHSDYRNYAESDFDPRNEVRPRSGYVEDIMNLLSAIQKSEFEFLDKENIGMLGHSMGGGITINVMTIAPSHVKAYVLLAPINANYEENFDRWVATEWPELAQEIFDTYGTFEEKPDFWESVSAINYLDNVKHPVQLHQGTADKDVPTQWSRDFAKALEKENKEIEYFEYPGIGHSFVNNFRVVMKHTIDFFDGQLK
ncbi:MAG: alpha/beta fold hydrolase [Patescibacteria group bacterium]|nr:alpha/beta fold hydrolase [Patescibacteria group bacterium]